MDVSNLQEELTWLKQEPDLIEKGRAFSKLYFSTNPEDHQKLEQLKKEMTPELGKQIFQETHGDHDEEPLDPKTRKEVKIKKTYFEWVGEDARVISLVDVYYENGQYRNMEQYEITLLYAQIQNQWKVNDIQFVIYEGKKIE